LTFLVKYDINKLFFLSTTLQKGEKMDTHSDTKQKYLEEIGEYILKNFEKKFKTATGKLKGLALNIVPYLQKKGYKKEAKKIGKIIKKFKQIGKMDDLLLLIYKELPEKYKDFNKLMGEHKKYTVKHDWENTLFMIIESILPEDKDKKEEFLKSNNLELYFLIKTMLNKKNNPEISIECAAIHANQK
jgi:hypothetical protein